MPTDEHRAMELLKRVPFGRVAASMRAMPFVAPARHAVAEGCVLLRMHEDLGYHRLSGGCVMAYCADNFGSADADLWSVQFTGTAEIIDPTAEELKLFGIGPHQVDDEPLDPVYMRLVPQFVTVHMLEHSRERRSGHAA
ncbi:pyridoxamine 5'-phosphate oxidase family protein [Streptomyces sp. AK02-01A]|uniref:pyridoxamine 5'-phosphate oxidase family protein n=1 Tax=Streptomyces sp. AK02-01A TaxID=3028648 RepID=UPI0029BDC8B3|nr:pyridoxamine 5'-phosphate oxidase family protein [Streptomyces sp. AK02-01A]MDX3850380.1 pyridoxamine 5'-phosphate oxidase family protein [Streptomyces sp. AK02-01A]